MATDDFQEDDFQPEPVAAPQAISTEDDFQSDDFQTEEPASSQPGPLEQARQMIRQQHDQAQASSAAQQQEAEQARIAQQQKDSDPRNWSSTRFKKDMPKPRTPQDQAFYDATLQDIKEREKGLTEKILTDVFGRPAAAHRETIRAVASGKDAGEAYQRGATNPDQSETFQNEAIRNANQMVTDVQSKLGIQLNNEDADTAIRFVAGLPASTAGMIADTVTNPADWLITVLGQRALKYVGKMQLGTKTAAELANTRIPGTPELPFTVKTVNRPPQEDTGNPGTASNSPEIPASQRAGGVPMNPGQQPPPANAPAPAQASPPPVAPPTPAAPNALQEGAESLYQKTFNRLQSLENVASEAKSKGYDLKPGDDPGLRSRSYLGIQGKVQSVLEDQTFRTTPEGKVVPTGEGLKPILNDFDRQIPNIPKEAKEADLIEYLKARRITEDLQRSAGGDRPMIASEEQTAAAQKVLADLQAKYGEGSAVLENTATRLYDYQKRVLENLVDSGNMSKAQYDAILAKNPNYVPFDRVLDEDGFGGVVPRIKERFSGANSPVKKITGSEREIHDPIESMIKNTYKIMDSAERNTVSRTVAKLADVLPGKIRLLEQADPKAIRYYEDGNPKYFMASENITDAMKGLNEVSSSLLVKILSMPAHWLRKGATLTPEFMARNVIRDQFTAAMQTKIGYKPLIDNTGALADILGKREVYYDWMRSGGAHSTIVELSRDNLGKMLADIRNKPNMLKNLNIITKAQDLSQLLEQATRVGVFKKAQQKGMSAVEAGFQSRESTVDFARIGSNMKEPNRIMAFLNASLQGMDKSVRTAASDPAGVAVKGSALITTPSVALYLLNRDDPEYKELPMWQKNLFWMFKVNDQWYRVPKPFGYGQVFGSVPERFMEYLDTKDPRAIDSLKKSMVESFSPISGEAESALLPTAIKPIIENFANRSFFTGRAIVPEHKMKLQPSEQSGRYTSQTARAVGKAANVSPAKFENLVSGYAGGLGRYALQLGDKIIDEVNKITGKPVEPKRPTEASDVPLVKGFTVRSPLASSESVAQFYEHRKKAETDHFTAKELYEQGDKVGAEKLLKSGNAQFYKLTDQAGDALSKLTAHADGLVKSGKYSEAELRQKLREIDEKKLEIARKVNKVINAKK